MRVLALTIPKLERITSDEVEEILGCGSTVLDSAVAFEAGPDDAAKFCYLTQSSSRVLLSMAEKKLSDPLVLAHELPIDGRTFRVVCKRVGKHSFDSIEMEAETGSSIAQIFGLKVDLENPDIIFYCYIFNDNFYLGIDLCGFDLSKRDYKIYNSPHSVKGNLAYCMLRLANFKRGQNMLDPLVKSGEFAIEAALYSAGRSPFFYLKDRFFLKKYSIFKAVELESFDIETQPAEIFAYGDMQPMVVAAKKNAKVAGIQDLIRFSRTDLQWIHHKFKEGSIESMATVIFKNRIEDGFDKRIKLFLKQIDYLLKEGSTIAILTRNPEEFCKHRSAEIVHIERIGDIVLLKK